jgi:dGTPase
VHTATRAAYGDDVPMVRHRADLLVPTETVHEIAVLKGIAAHYVMRTPERARIMAVQRELLAELFEALVASEGAALDAMFRADFAAAADDAARTRVVVDQVASLTDGSAASWHARLTGRVRA